MNDPDCGAVARIKRSNLHRAVGTKSTTNISYYEKRQSSITNINYHPYEAHTECAKMHELINNSNNS